MSSNAILVDFDGTIVEHKYPEIGQPLPGVFETLKDLKSSGYRLVLWTCREGKTLDEAIEFCRKNGVEFDGVNETLADEEFRDDGLARKPYCNLFIDDKNIGGFMGWDKVRQILLRKEQPDDLKALRKKWVGKKIYGVLYEWGVSSCNSVVLSRIEATFDGGIAIYAIDEVTYWEYKAIYDVDPQKLDKYLTARSQNGDGASLI